MKQMNLSDLTDKELLQEAKRIRSTKLYDAVIFGVLIGITTYSSVVNGFGLLSFLPLIYVPVAIKNKTKNKEVEELLTERNLT